MSDLLPQPPPSVPPPPAGPEALRSQRKMRRILQLGIGCIVLPFLVALLCPVTLKAKKATDRTEAINNAKQVGVALQEFQAEYGRLPDASTASLVKAKTGTSLTLGSASSNQLFRQLLVTHLKSETPFYAKTATRRRPDNRFSDDAHALAPGECGFAYVSGLTGSEDPDTPVIMTPMIPGTTCFDAGIYGDKAVILFLDNSATVLPIDRAGHARWNGMDFFDPRQPFWHGKVPDLKWPE